MFRWPTSASLLFAGPRFRAGAGNESLFHARHDIQRQRRAEHAGRGGIFQALKRSRKAERMFSLYDFVDNLQGKFRKKMKYSDKIRLKKSAFRRCTPV